MPVDLNKSLIMRLVKYQRVLRKLKSLGFVKVFSNNLGDAVGVSPSVVRKDFSLINIPGNKRGGYNIDTLTEDLSRVLGTQAEKKVILIGCGRIGQALMHYPEFSKEGIAIVAGFDISPSLQQPGLPVPVHPMSDLRSYIQENHIEIAILAVPESSASQVFNELLEAGVRGFLNFTPVELKCTGRCERVTCSRNCTVVNVNIGLELENLFYLVGNEHRA